MLGSYYILKYTDIAHVYVYGCMFLFFYFFPFSLALSGVRADSLASNHNFGDVSSDSSGDDKYITWLAWKHLLVHEAGFSALAPLDCSAFRYRLVDNIKADPMSLLQPT